MDLQLELGALASEWIQYYDKALSVTSGTIEVVSRDNEIYDALLEKLKAFTLGLTNGVIDGIELAGADAITAGANKIYDTLGIDKNSLEMANTIVNIMSSQLSMLVSILKFIPQNVKVIPSTGAALTSIVSSYKTILSAAFLDVLKKIMQTVETLSVNMPSTLEILKLAELVIEDTIYSLIDSLCYEYTGLTLVEIYKLCNEGFRKYKEWKEARRREKEAKENDKDKAEDEVTEINKSGSKSSIEVNVNTDLLKSAFMEWLSLQSDTLYNSFILITIRETVDDIRYVFQLMTSCSLSSLADTINSFDDLIQLLEELGCGDDSLIITLEEAKSSALNMISGAMNSLVSTMTSNLEVTGGIKKETTFDIKTDVDTKSITVTYFTHPSKPSVGKKVYNTFKKAETSDKKKIFSESDLVLYQLKIKEYIEISSGGTFLMRGYNIIIVFDIKEETTTTTTPIPNLPDLSKFELGFVEEEYAIDPTLATRRKTIELIHRLFDLLKLMMPYVKLFATLLSNYNTNKELYKENSIENLLDLFKINAGKSGLDKHVDKSELNFYVVRTLELYDYLKKEFNIKNNPIITSELTIELISWIKDNDLDYSVLNKNLETILYIDSDSIKKQLDEMDEELRKAGLFFGDDARLFIDYPKSLYDNGTLFGLTKVLSLYNLVYYTDSSLSAFPSLLIEAFSKGLDPSI